MIFNFIIDTPIYHIFRYQADLDLSDILVGNRFFALCKTQYEVSVISDDRLEGYKEKDSSLEIQTLYILVVVENLFQ